MTRPGIDPTPSPTRDAHGVEAALEELRLAEARLARRVHRASASAPLDRAALRYILTRCDADDPATPSEIADHLAVSPAAISGVLRRLSAGGAIATERRDDDRRSKRVRLLDRTELEDGADPVVDGIRSVVAGLRDEEAVLMRQCLDRLRQAIDDA